MTTIRELAENVRELLWSLGIKNAVKAEPSTRCGWPTGEILYVIRFTTFSDQPTTRLVRKAVRQRIRMKQTRSNFHYLESIEAVDHPVQMQCIQVDSPSHQYLAGKSMVPTHNSELAAAVALYLLYADNEPSAEVYGAAADRQQASIVFDVARQMVDMTPALVKRSKIMTAGKRIVNYQNAGYYQVLSAEVGTKHGLNVSGLVFDELHSQPNRQLSPLPVLAVVRSALNELPSLRPVCSWDYQTCYNQRSFLHSIDRNDLCSRNYGYESHSPF